MLELLYSFLSNQDSLFILIFKLIFYPEIYKLFYVYYKPLILEEDKNKPAQQKFEANKSQQPSNSASNSNEKQSWTNVTKWAMLAEKNPSNYTACIWKSGQKQK